MPLNAERETLRVLIFDQILLTHSNVEHSLLASNQQR